MQTNPMECTPAKLKCRAIAHAEKLVGFPTSVFHLQSLMTDDVTSMTSHLRKLMTSDHPILKTVKRLIHFEGKTDAQVRGLIVLLLSRATATKQVRISTVCPKLFGTPKMYQNRPQMSNYCAQLPPQTGLYIHG